MDSYYKPLTPEDRANVENYNFDHPNASDIDLLYHHLLRLRSGKSIEVPEYDFVTHSRTSKTKTLYGANVIIVEGILAFYSPQVTKLMDLKVFVDTDADERLGRRLRRDISERGRDVKSGQNKIALQLIIQHINKRLKLHTTNSRRALAKMELPVMNGTVTCDGTFGPKPWGDDPSQNGDSEKSADQISFDARLPNGWIDEMGRQLILPPRVHVLPSVPQTRGMHTIMRDRDTDQDSFVFYSERLMRPLCEYAMNLLPHMDVEVETPQGIPYRGRRLAAGTQVCGVSILRAGEALESSLCAVCKDVRLGKILIQTNPDTCEPELHYIRLPSDIKDCFVILMDSTVATGAAAIMAMRILVEHDVPEDHIILISLLMAIQGVHSVAYTYPKAHIVTTAVDGGLNDQYHIVPGVGNFGDRYFGTTHDLASTYT
ncbi:Uridine kinase [Fasciola hepatica]|uniref:uridine/cytidine kinase n=2 Tax=Fasciola TaxID=6191 RepID=A0A4E0R696_FASHE|nr:Uridine kinase [Fasciola hepatica]